MTQTKLNQTFLDEMVDALTDRVSEHYGFKVKITAEPGRKYIKIVVELSGSRSVYCFFDYDGNIYKAASWKAPAKHVRGSVFDDDYSWGKSLGPYGAVYLR